LLSGALQCLHYRDGWADSSKTMHHLLCFRIWIHRSFRNSSWNFYIRCSFVSGMTGWSYTIGEVFSRVSWESSSATGSRLLSVEKNFCKTWYPLVLGPVIPWVETLLTLDGCNRAKGVLLYSRQSLMSLMRVCVRFVTLSSIHWPVAEHEVTSFAQPHMYWFNIHRKKK